MPSKPDVATTNFHEFILYAGRKLTGDIPTTFTLSPIRNFLLIDKYCTSRGATVCSLGQTRSLQNCYKQAPKKIRRPTVNGSFFRYFQTFFYWGSPLARCGRKPRRR